MEEKRLMPTIKKFEDLDVWNLSRELSKSLGELLDRGTCGNNFRMINQVEGSSGSIMDNIAEGFERGTRTEFIQFLGYSKGSCGELSSQLYRMLDRKYIDQKQFGEYRSILIRTSAVLQKFFEYLQKTNVQGTRKK